SAAFEGFDNKVGRLGNLRNQRFNGIRDELIFRMNQSHDLFRIELVDIPGPVIDLFRRKPVKQVTHNHELLLLKDSGPAWPGERPHMPDCAARGISGYPDT